MRPYVEEVARELRLADRKSTRLNSSHSQISYAVFCLKNKNTRLQYTTGGPGASDGSLIIMHNTHNAVVFFYANLCPLPCVTSNARFPLQSLRELESTT